MFGIELISFNLSISALSGSLANQDLFFDWIIENRFDILYYFIPISDLESWVPHTLSEYESCNIMIKGDLDYINYEDLRYIKHLYLSQFFDKGLIIHTESKNELFDYPRNVEEYLELLNILRSRRLRSSELTPPTPFSLELKSLITLIL